MVSVVNRTQLDNLPSESISQALRYSSGIRGKSLVLWLGIDYSKMRSLIQITIWMRMLSNSGI